MDIRVAGDGSLHWRGRRYRCLLGRAGISADKREGDGTTPAGRFALRQVFHRRDRVAAPRTALPVTALTPLDGWCDDPEHPDYNRRIRLPHPARHERLWRQDGRYDVLVVLGHNDDPPVPGLGSAIFLHVAAERGPTEGCIALAMPDLLEIVRGCDATTRICVGVE